MKNNRQQSVTVESPDINTEMDIPSLEEVQEEHRRLQFLFRFKRTLLSTIAILLVAAAIATLTANLWMPVLRIYGTSMSPTLEAGQIVLAVKGKHFDHGDLAAFYYGSKILIKRVIAGPGDWVDISEEGIIRVNGEVLEEPYVKQIGSDKSDISYPYQVPDKHWFLVGDNRDESIDSRFSQVGSISEDMMMGTVFLRIWPLTSFRSF